MKMKLRLKPQKRLRDCAATRANAYRAVGELRAFGMTSQARSLELTLARAVA